jgi:hypothetical protein
MDFAEHHSVPGLYVNVRFPEVQIHKGTGRYIVTHHGIQVTESDTLFGAVRLAKEYMVLGGPLEIA